MPVGLAVSVHLGGEGGFHQTQLGELVVGFFLLVFLEVKGLNVRFDDAALRPSRFGIDD